MYLFEGCRAYAGWGGGGVDDYISVITLLGHGKGKNSEKERGSKRRKLYYVPFFDSSCPLVVCLWSVTVSV